MAATIDRAGAPANVAPRHISHTVEIVGRIEAARDTVTLWLALPGTLQAPSAYIPGQFITLTIPTARGGALYRSYSLCGDGRADRPWEITIKRQANGTISPFLYSAAQPGVRLNVSAPQGMFTLPRSLAPSSQLVFVALGSGITPIYAMLRTLGNIPPERRPRVQLHYAYHSPEDAIYGRELATLDPERRWLTQWHYISTAGRRISTEQVLAHSTTLLPMADWFICGPSDFKRSLQSGLAARGVGPARVHVEVFTSPRVSPATGSALGAAGRGTARVRLADSGAVVEGRPGETLLEMLERNGYRPEYSCRAGACASCRLHVLSGRVEGDDGGALSPQERAAGYVLSCQAQPVGAVVLASASGQEPPAGSGGGNGWVAGASPRRPARHPASTALRWGLAAASLGLFAGAWSLAGQVSASASAGTSSSNSTVTGQPCTWGDGDHGYDDDDRGGATTTCSPSLPSGSSGITTQPVQPPSTISGSSR